MSFKYLQANTCPICSGEHHSCRESDRGFIFCRSGYEDVPGYRLIKESSIGFYMYALAEESKPSEGVERRRDYWKEQQEKERAERARQNAIALSPEKRDIEIKKILASLDLTPEHRQKLKLRGLTDEEIRGGNYRSVRPWQPLDRYVDPNLAGVKASGRSLLIPDGGILCPVRDVAGRLVSWQTRADNPINGGRYRWPSGDKSLSIRPSAHVDGEMPLAFHGIQSNAGIVGLGEGTGFKPHLCSSGLGIPVIGAAGCNFSGSANTLLTGLERLGCSVVRFYPDAGTLANPVLVKQWRKTYKLLSKRGYKIEVGWWGQWSKGDPDIDELPREELGSIQYLSFEDWVSLTRPLESLNPTYVHSRYFNEAGIQTGDSKLVVLVGGKGLGKSVFIRGEIADDFLVLGLTHRRLLGKELSASWGVDYVDDDSPTKILGYVACIDSLHAKSKKTRFDLEDWHGATVTIDEVKQFLWHLLSSQTAVAKRRVEIIKNLAELLRYVCSTGGRVIVADADYDESTHEILSQLCGVSSDETMVIVNTFSPPKRKLFVYEESTPDRLIADSIKAINSGGRHLILNTSVDEKLVRSDAHLLEHYHKRCPGKKGIVIDGKTVRTTGHEASAGVANVSDLIRDYDFAIISTVCETGTSIVDPSITGVWCIANGVSTVEGVGQFLARERGQAPRFFWCKQNVRTPVGNGATAAAEILASEKKLVRDNTTALVRAGASVFEGVQAFLLLNWWAERGAQINAEAKSYRQSCLAKLSQEYEVIPVGEATAQERRESEQVKSDLVEVRNKRLEEKYEAIAQAPNPDDLTLARLQKQETRTPEEQVLVEKGNVCRRYGLNENEVDRTLIEDDAKGIHPKMKLHYLLTMGEEFTVARSSKSFTEKEYFVPDINRGSDVARVKLLQRLDLERFLVDGAEFTNADAQRWLTEVVTPLRDELPFKVSDRDSGMGLLQRVLSNYLGLKMERVKRARLPDNKRSWIYRMSLDLERRGLIFARWWDEDYSLLAGGQALQSA